MDILEVQPSVSCHCALNTINKSDTYTMMKLFLFASLVVGAAAFSPVSVKTASTSTKLAASFESDIGATLPLGFFDPLGLVADGDQAKFDRLRLVELKHGRISMLAVEIGRAHV